MDQLLGFTRHDLIKPACLVRPDILCDTIFLTTRVHESREEDVRKLYDVLEYLNGTRQLGLCLGAGQDGKFHLNVFADAAHNVHVDARSQGGIAMQIGRGTTLAESSRVKGVPISSTESELIMAAKGMSFGIRELEFSKCQQIVAEDDYGTLHEDNTFGDRLSLSTGSISHRL